MPTSAWARAGGVVDAVAHHRHHPSLLLQPPHRRRLVLGQNLGLELRYAHFPRDGGGGGGVVAGKHHHLQPHPAQLGDGRRRRRLGGVGQGDDAPGDAVGRQENRRTALFRRLGCGGVQPVQRDAELPQQRPVAELHRPPVHFRRHPQAGPRLKAGGGRRFQAAPLRLGGR